MAQLSRISGLVDGWYSDAVSNLPIERLLCGSSARPAAIPGPVKTSFAQARLKTKNGLPTRGGRFRGPTRNRTEDLLIMSQLL